MSWEKWDDLGANIIIGAVIAGAALSVSYNVATTVYGWMSGSVQATGPENVTSVSCPYGRKGTGNGGSRCFTASENKELVDFASDGLRYKMSDY